MRRLMMLPCAGETIVATLDEAAGVTGLLIVSGGNEIRCGAHRGMALLAGRLAADGVPVFRYDRRGVGDSTGRNGGYATSVADLAAAAAALRHEQPQITRLIGFGNCDAASALSLFGREAGIDALVLANPWVVETNDLPPAAAIREHYVARLLDPGAWKRLARGRIDLGKFIRGLRRIVTPEPQELADRIVAAIASWGNDARIVLAQGDATAIAFAAAAAARDLPTTIERIVTDSHSFARTDDATALETVIRQSLNISTSPA